MESGKNCFEVQDQSWLGLDCISEKLVRCYGCDTCEYGGSICIHLAGVLVRINAEVKTS